MRKLFDDIFGDAMRDLDKSPAWLYRAYYTFVRKLGGIAHKIMKTKKRLALASLLAAACLAGCAGCQTPPDIADFFDGLPCVVKMPSLPSKDDPAPSTPAPTPEPSPAPTPAPSPAPSADAIAYSSLRWDVGGQKPGDRPITIGWTGGATFDNNGCSFALPSYNGTSAYPGGSGGDAPYIFCVFVADGRGGKIDWVGGSRRTRDFKHMSASGNYNNWHSLESAVHASSKLYFVILGGNGRSPIIEATRK